MSETAIQDVFLNEAKEILANLESDMVLFEEEGSAEILNRIFRSVHTLKGSSAVAGFHEVSEFTHSLENVLDSLRAGTLAIDDRLTDMLLGSFDWVRLSLFGGGKPEDLASVKQKLLDWMGRYKSGAEMQKQEMVPAEDTVYRYYSVRARFREDIFESGIDPLSIMEDLVSLGTVEILAVNDADLPRLEALDPEKCYLGWDVVLKSGEPKEKIEAVFLFVKDDNRIVIEDVSSRYAEGNDDEKILEDRKLGEILVSRGIISGKELDEVLAEQIDMNRKIGDIVVEKGYATEREIQHALGEQDRIRTRIETGTVRVDAKKLDSLLNLLGEIVIGQSGIERIADEIQDEHGFMLKNALYGLDRATREFQEQIMSIRMLPIGPTFEQFRRFVRDAARDLGKEIKLEIFGEETELDKTVIERISDPLKHMIRNAIDHGIEDVAERERKGKPREGRIRLNAYHQEGNIYIEVSDDGKGINKDKIRDKAILLGLAKPGEEMSDSRLFSFMFLPGFTTVDHAGDLSGRGVGMDVVKTNIENLRGTVDIETADDIGTTFRIKLPLTLAIIEGMLVRCGSSVYIIPLLSILKCKRPAIEEINTVEGKGELVKVNDAYVPLVRLYEHFGIRADCDKPWESIVVIVESGKGTAGIMVDELIGQQQIVIKSMSGGYSGTRAVSGASILGDGRVALILDVHGLISELAER